MAKKKIALNLDYYEFRPQQGLFDTVSNINSYAFDTASNSSSSRLTEDERTVFRTKVNCIDLSGLTNLVTVNSYAFENVGQGCKTFHTLSLRGLSNLTLIGTWAFFHVNDGLTRPSDDRFNDVFEEIDLSGCTSLTTLKELAFGYVGMYSRNFKRVILPEPCAITTLDYGVFNLLGRYSLMFEGFDFTKFTELETIGYSAFIYCGYSSD